MLTTFKMALLTALMSTGMEMAILGDKECIFKYDRIMPRVTTELTEEQRLEIRDLLKEMEGKPCHEISFWASDIVDMVPMAYEADKREKHKQGQ